MRRIAIALMGIICLSSVAGAADTMFGDGFKKADPAAYLENAGALYQDAAIVNAPGLAGTKALRLRYENQIAAAFYPVPVNASRAYSLVFKGKWANNQTIENNPTFRSALGQTWETMLVALPTASITFLDGKHKPLRSKVLAVMPYGRWRTYRFAFYPPAGAAYMQLVIKPGRYGGPFYLTSPTFTSLPRSHDGVVLNFRQTATHVSGNLFGYLLDDHCHATATGSVLVDSGDDFRRSRSETIPLSHPGTYRLVVQGIAKGRSHHVTVRFFDDTGKATGTVGSAKAIAKPLTFTLPRGTARCRLTIHNIWLTSIRIQRVR